MLEKLKAEVLLAFRELGRYGLDKHARGAVSAIDRETGLIVMKSAGDAFVADMCGNILEGSGASSSDIQSHIALYQAFPELGGIVRPHARYATIFARTGMDIPALGTFHGKLFHVGIPCAVSVADLGDTFHANHIDPLGTPAALVLNQSAYAWGMTALDAVVNAAALEETANMAYHTMRLDSGIQRIQ